LNYVKKLKIFKPSVYLTFGTACHETIQEWLRVMYEESAKKAEEMDLGELLKERMYENYKESLAEQKGEHFIKPEEFKDFIQDGVTILDFLKKKRSEYFNLKTTKLIGIEIPIEQYIVDEIPNVIMTGSIDLIFFNKNTETYEIYDIKTSTKGWNDNDKKDKNKISQLLLYKHFYSRALNVPIDKIEVKFFIVKRKLPTVSEYVIKPIQEFKPANGSRKVKEAYEDFTNFVKTVFNPQGEYVDHYRVFSQIQIHRERKYRESQLDQHWVESHEDKVQYKERKMQESLNHHDILHVLALIIEGLLGYGREEPIESFPN
jgi:hypothetical protein